MTKITLADKFALFADPWHPRIIAALNGQHVKLVRLVGEFVWHSHEAEDELFFVVAGRLRMVFRDRVETLGPGELIVIPRGTEHKPVALGEALVMLFEPDGTLNTGDAGGPRTVDAPEWI